MGTPPILAKRPGFNVPPVGVAAAIDDHRVIEQGMAIDIFGLIHFFEETGELFHVPEIDLRYFVDHVLLVSMMC